VTWPPTKVPPLRADVDRRRRALRRALAAEAKAWALGAAGLVGAAAGAVTAIYTCPGGLA
jgi:hypothetical protein